MKPLNILVFPCGSEIALEIHRSLKYSRFINLYGASSVSDHGRFVYQNYIDNIPLVTDENFIDSIKKVVSDYDIDAIYPAMDSVITKIKKYEEYLNCKVISSPYETTLTCLSKKETYQRLKNILPVPAVYENIESIDKYPIFAKPDIGYGSRGAQRLNSKEDLQQYIKEYPEGICMNYLSGEEYTVDCFTNNDGNLLFAGPRLRKRITNGISVNTVPVSDEILLKYAGIINKNLNLRGAWFFQMKKDQNGHLTLLEIAARLGGSSALYRNKGINFALLSIFDMFGYDVSIIENNYNIELDRALDNKYKINIDYKEVYIDFDDCLVINGKINETLVSFIFQCINQQIKVKLITKHCLDIKESLNKFRLDNLFDEVIHLKQEDNKYKYITSNSSIFIDDSFAERKDVFKHKGIPVFSPDMVESLMQ